MPRSFGAGIMPPANAGWSGPLLGEDTCGCGHPFAEHSVVDPFVTEWYFLHYHCRYCCREITGECCYLNAGLEFDEHEGSCLVEDAGLIPLRPPTGALVVANKRPNAIGFYQ